MFRVQAMSIEKEGENLFSYGTLQTEATQLATFGRTLKCKPDTLVGYSLTMIPVNQRFAELSGSTHHRNIQFTGLDSDFVEGGVLRVTSKELEQADEYEEVADYKRVLVQLTSGVEAWVYLHAAESK
jgi:gamma-glutamylcyclotransferase (GGCT)/AIG2-like uncharacterized protein YtfP